MSLPAPPRQVSWVVRPSADGRQCLCCPENRLSPFLTRPVYKLPHRRAHLIYFGSSTKSASPRSIVNDSTPPSYLAGSVFWPATERTSPGLAARRTLHWSAFSGASVQFTRVN